MKARGWALTDVGLKRDHNEDSFLCNDGIGLYAVADGMGGHLGGERASSMAVEILEREIDRGVAMGVTDTSDDLPTNPSGNGVHPIAGALRQAVTEATKAIWENAQREPECQGMGTTLTGMLFHGGKASIVHVGDSRAYLYRHGKVRQLTDDHSWIAEQVRAGLLDPNDALRCELTGFRDAILQMPGARIIPLDAGLAAVRFVRRAELS